MKVTEEIDALETMAISPIHFLVTPKFLAMIVMLPCLTIWANLMGILGGALFGVAQAGFTWLGYIQASIDSLFLRDITTGLIKSVMFGITITAWGVSRVCRQQPARGSGPLNDKSCCDVDLSCRDRGSRIYWNILFRGRPVERRRTFYG